MGCPSQSHNDTNIITYSTLGAYQYMKIHLCSHHPRSLWRNYNSNFHWCLYTLHLLNNYSMSSLSTHWYLQIKANVENIFSQRICMLTWQRWLTIYLVLRLARTISYKQDWAKNCTQWSMESNKRGLQRRPKTICLKHVAFLFRPSL